MIVPTRDAFRLNSRISGNNTVSINLEDYKTQEDTLIDYKYNEGVLVNELMDYIDRTYGEHYAKGVTNIQTLELIGKEPERGYHYCIGNAIKYADRGQHKGQSRKDLLKLAHYSILALYHFDLMENENND